MGNKFYNKTGYLKEMNNYQACKKEMKSCLSEEYNIPCDSQLSPSPAV